MHGHVSLQIARLREALLTNVTLVGLFPRVCSFVFLESGRIVESMITMTAPVGLLIRVGSQMHHRVRLVVKNLVYTILQCEKLNFKLITKQ
jgi:hypothetical protein